MREINYEIVYLKLILLNIKSYSLYETFRQTNEAQTKSIRKEVSLVYTVHISSIAINMHCIDFKVFTIWQTLLLMTRIIYFHYVIEILMI